MARPDATTVGLFGTGRQAKTQLEAVCEVRRIRRVDVFSRNAERCAIFAEEMSNALRTEVVPAMRPDLAVMEKDIVITATSAKTPVFEGRFVADGTHLNVVGSNFLSKAEIDVDAVRRSDIIVCDSIEACRLEAGDFVAACEAGVTCYENMHDLAAVVTGQATGRATSEDVTLFKSVGLAIEDVALGHEVLRRAREAGVGRAIVSCLAGGFVGFLHGHEARATSPEAFSRSPAHASHRVENVHRSVGCSRHLSRKPGQPACEGTCRVAGACDLGPGDREFVRAFVQ
jgi:ornithine cyclodeaminase/alanine dehydrogenase-like protein (mu-crystallin family)